MKITDWQYRVLDQRPNQGCGTLGPTTDPNLGSKGVSLAFHFGHTLGRIFVVFSWLEKLDDAWYLRCLVGPRARAGHQRRTVSTRRISWGQGRTGVHYS